MIRAHTPGPWSLNTQYADTEIRGPAESGVLIAVMSPWGVAADEPSPQHANSRLIAAAPDLLAAAQAAWNCIAELPPTQARVEVAQMLQTAIEKAIGSAA